MNVNDSSSRAAHPAGHSVAPDEIARFSALADRWWDPSGPMRPLHAMNGLRLDWARRHLPAPGTPGEPATRLLDIGCGAGLASEGLARMGYDVTGLDASDAAIAAARAHLADHPLPPDGGSLAYRVGSAEELQAEGARFAAITALEVIEHVTDPAAFLRVLADMVAPGGVIIVSTLNRTLRSLATAKIGAEYILRLLPAGTHEWRKFITPAELGAFASQAGLRVSDIAGMVPALGGWRESHDLGVNYIASLSAP
ncbi:ubiquinone biosynthesis O-methyltransferase [Gluconacetobacter diazotrophicus PA1 5]|uniref:Ubiquinone biosynthesis O-methyltransferase n=2 Tax=Gluconacetobacter diazotrophicus TaxID=33996 RepID=A9HJ43_GLUDA|nr:bifunctional 2-polyprenyl-6-hydroxyphenol methylase/3-demethylubiquinol 3-O-methyltransferase UbiG [Gluconacetobacter diazotrophicus]ACI49931.1 ubiquinone biosynthesis O-methyltransferase [Gluconacetobacter diazotrophicus PA1 5]MBB2156482.1 bifunctional 2-polyprenyl-6-hydroxyphenol methylase/3-demethylubiquinol 3-O-methyltransferase UbiG [Gluconacetobacter diazotrophicus]TWB05975.1 3-demethylubiquinone-9 3-methyltransferase [Gluconacetobacter diazotrophicus]CAP55851.1 3-demethylubiquinone-9 